MNGILEAETLGVEESGRINKVVWMQPGSRASAWTPPGWELISRQDSSVGFRGQADEVGEVGTLGWGHFGSGNAEEP